MAFSLHSSQTQARQSGQIGLMVVLLMVVILTIGVSVASQSTREVLLSNQEDESTRVLNAAEAGVEAALATDLKTAVSGTPVSLTVPNSDAAVTYTVTQETDLNTLVPEGGAATVKLADLGGVSPVTSLQIFWGRETDCAQKPASLIFAITSYDIAASPKSATRYLAATSRGCNNGDSLQDSRPVVPGGGGFFSRVNIPVNPTDVVVRIRAYYNDTQLRVNGLGGTLPTQAYVIESTAVNQLGDKNETRSVRVNRTVAAAPSLLDFSLFSGTTLIK